MKLPFSMVPSSNAAAIVGGIVVVALVAFAIKQAITPPPLGRSGTP